MRSWRRTWRSFRRIRKDERGHVLIYFTMLLPVAVGIIGLALDGGSFYHLNSDLQELADAAALAGAAELDGAQDAITRATTQAQNLLTNNVNWSNVALSGTQVSSVTFYSSLNPDTATTDPKQAFYIKVTTVNRQVAPTFLAAVTSNKRSTSASAMAESSFDTCVPLQSFVCNPFESQETNKGNAKNFATNVPVGTMMHLVNGAGAAGNWGLVEAPNENGNPHNQTPFWAESNVSACYSATGPTTTDTGNVAKFAQQGMNVRFDSPIGSGSQSLSAPIVINGYQTSGKGNNCVQYDPNSDTSWTAAQPYTTGTGKTKQSFTFNQADSNYQKYDNYCGSTQGAGSTCSGANPCSCPLPRDRTFSSSGVGSGANSTDLQAYWTNHHPGTLPAGVTTRYQIYGLEAAGTGNAGTWLTDKYEPHTPTATSAGGNAPACSNSTLGSTARRLIEVAVVDCSYWGITGKKQLPQTTLVSQFFMTESALSDGSIYGELVGVSSANTPGGPIIHNVQLVR